MIYVVCQQGSAEWLELRSGVITASRCEDACSRLKSGDFSQKALNYAAQVAMERIYKNPCDDTYVNFAMRRGSELEPHARQAYEEATGHIALEAGIVLTDDSLFGYSTDGFVSTDGAIEIKCPLSAFNVVSMWRESDISDYEYQIQMGLWITGRRWIDFVMYDPRLKNVGKELFLKRIDRDDKFIAQMEERLMEFRALVDEHEAALRTPLQEAA